MPRSTERLADDAGHEELAAYARQLLHKKFGADPMVAAQGFVLVAIYDLLNEWRNAGRGEDE